MDCIYHRTLDPHTVLNWDYFLHFGNYISDMYIYRLALKMLGNDITRREDPFLLRLFRNQVYDMKGI
jgi:hypothetical protein